VTRALASLVLCAACGHHATQVGGDAAVDGAPDFAVLVQRTTSTSMTGTTALVPIPPPARGDLLVVGVAMSGVVERNVQSIVTTAVAPQPLAPFALERTDSCGRVFELWAISDVNATADSIVVQLAAPATFTVYTLEASGLARFPLLAETNLGSPTLPAMDVPIQAAAGQLLVASFTTCANLTGLDPASPFTSFDIANGTAMAFYIPAASGSYAAHWLADAGEWDAWTLAFR
jgi:hypothetical protein